jgi:hypothetical protein
MEYSPPCRDVRRAACASGLRQLAADDRSDVHRAHAVKVQVHGLATLQPGPVVSGGLTNRGASARTSRAARLGSRLSGVSSSWRRSTPQACSNSSPCVQDAGRAWVDLLQQNERRTELASSAPSRTACLAPGIDVPGNYPDPGIITCCQSRRHRPTPGRSMESAALPRRRPSLPPHRAMRCQSEPGDTARPASE